MCCRIQFRNALFFQKKLDRESSFASTVHLFFFFPNRYFFPCLIAVKAEEHAFASWIQVFSRVYDIGLIFSCRETFYSALCSDGV